MQGSLARMAHPALAPFTTMTRFDPAHQVPGRRPSLPFCPGSSNWESAFSATCMAPDGAVDMAPPTPGFIPRSRRCKSLVVAVRTVRWPA